MIAGADKAAASKPGPRCPVCGKSADRAHRPFCSKRCAEVDLGRWLKGQYVVQSAPIGEDAYSDLPGLDEADDEV